MTEFDEFESIEFESTGNKIDKTEEIQLFNFLNDATELINRRPRLASQSVHPPAYLLA